jgi:hypothetical protein
MITPLGYSLSFAINIINNANRAQFIFEEIVAIMYEDGSCTKFLYKLEGDTEYRFVDLKKLIASLELMKQYKKI